MAEQRVSEICRDPTCLQRVSAKTCKLLLVPEPRPGWRTELELSRWDASERYGVNGEDRGRGLTPGSRPPRGLFQEITYRGPCTHVPRSSPGQRALTASVARLAPQGRISCCKASVMCVAGSVRYSSSAKRSVLSIRRRSGEGDFGGRRWTSIAIIDDGWPLAAREEGGRITKART